MADEPAPTCFAPSERACSDEIQRQFSILANHAIPGVLNAIPIIAMVLNRQRQVVHGNRKFIDVIGIGDIREALGKRPGEAFRCIHAAEHPGGCGSSEFCAQCGAVRSILLGLAGQDNIQECAINRDAGTGIEALDLRVSSASIHLNAEHYLIFSISDVSHEKRRRTLERLFFHDMLNTVGGVQGLMEFLVEEAPQSLQADARLIHRAVSQLTDEITYQKQLLAAETNELETNITPLRSVDILDVVEATFQNGEQARQKRLERHDRCSEVVFHSDPVLLRRVLGNMVKNALEATPPGGLVRLGCTPLADAVEFWVQNAGEIPRSVQMRIFSRSFSTKGLGRGLGTYSIKLLTERYLGGRASFTVNPGEGIVFRVRLPLEPDLSDAI